MGALILLGAISPADAQLVTRLQESLRGGVTLVGNSWWNNNTAIDVDSDAATGISSSADLVLPTGSAIYKAFLYVESYNYCFQRILFKPPGGVYVSLASSSSEYLASRATTGVTCSSGTAGNINQLVFDVTNRVRAGGTGTYTMGVPTASTSSGGGWSIIVVYKNPASKLRYVVVADNWQRFANSQVQTTITGVLLPASGTINAIVGLTGSQGNAGLTDELLIIGNNGGVARRLLHPETNVANDTLNGSIAFAANNNVQTDGGNLQFRGRCWAQRNPNSGFTGGTNACSSFYDASIFDARTGQNTSTGAVEPIFLPSSTPINITLRQASTGGDTLVSGAYFVSVDMAGPALTKSVAPARIASGQTATYTFTIRNTESGASNQTNLSFTDTLPANLRVKSPLNWSSTGTIGTPTVAAPGNTAIQVSGLGIAQGATATISVDVTNVPGQANTSCAQTLPAFTNTAENITSIDSRFANDIQDICLEVMPISVSGRVFEDIDADLLAAGQGAGDARNPGISGRTVRLFNASGTEIASATTQTDGTYSMVGLFAGEAAYIAVDAPTVTSAGTSGVIAEQTYASAGTGNSGTAGGTGYGPLCVSSDLSYTQQNATTTAGIAANPANGACYGGRRGAVADSGTTTLNSKEHVIRVVSDGSASVSGVDFGFSFNVVTNVNNGGQGSLRQFIANANAITATSGGGGEPDGGANRMRFVPAIAMNGNDWWEVAPTTQLPPLTAAGTTIEGKAYDNANGTVAFLPAAIGSGGLVGADWNAAILSQVASPKLAIANGLAADALTIAAGANDTTIQNFGVFGTTGSAGGGIAKTASGAITRLMLQGNVLGVLPNGVAAAGTLSSGIRIANMTSGSFEISNNYMRAVRDSGIDLTAVTQSTVGNYVISNNEISRTGGSGISLETSSRISVQGNLVTQAGMTGIELRDNGGDSLLTQNTVSDNRGTGSEGAAIRITAGSNNTVTYNKLVGSTSGPGILQRSNSAGNRLSENQFGGNAGNAIDNTPSDSPNGVTISSACQVNGTQLGRPVLASAILVDNTLRLSGSYCATGTFRLEVYKVAPGTAGDIGTDGLQAGEGGTFLGALTGLSGGVLDGTLTLSPGDLVAGTDHVTAILIRETAEGGAVGDTSEFSANALAVSVPFVTIAKVSVGGVGRFGFAGAAANANGFPADGSYAVETITPGEAVEGGGVPLAAADVETRIVEAIPAGWVLESARCEDRRAAATGNPAGQVIGSVSDGKTLVIPAGNARAGADLLCTFTNRFQGFAV
ncbi:right-handed parallel beta-helix repeat-containing protein, partial [Chelativorans sp. J32]|uniref:prealbumin-like fold domain-containing protein n=1 Tax=Chelativorans sp. J32 TaxID=935840 RepID=UPI0018DDDA5E